MIANNAVAMLHRMPDTRAGWAAAARPLGILERRWSAGFWSRVGPLRVTVMRRNRIVSPLAGSRTSSACAATGPLYVAPGRLACPARVAGHPRLASRLGERGGIVHEVRGHLRGDPCKCVVEGGGRDPNRLLIRLGDGVDGGLHAKDHCALQLHQRGKQALARLLMLGGVRTQGVDAWRLQEPLQDRAGHHTARTFLDEGGNNGLQ